MLSAAAAQDGTEFGVKLGSKYARREKVNSQEMQRQRQTIANEIYNRQVQPQPCCFIQLNVSLIRYRNARWDQVQ
jgi:hypothetical protein